MNYNIYIRFPPAATFVVLDLFIYKRYIHIYISPFAILTIIHTLHKHTRKNSAKNRSYFFKNILSIYICILIHISNKMVILVYNYIYLIYFKKSMNDFFQKFFLVVCLLACLACLGLLAACVRTVPVCNCTFIGNDIILPAGPAYILLYLA